uniref:Uncharacterized protein n=1 Tax=Arundo donax TaxID=35708 RepID=A0A0A9BI10_ARUDO
MLEFFKVTRSKFFI